MLDVQNILIIRPSALGDVCRSVPVLASLRRAYPGARIDWLVQQGFADAIWHHPGLSECVLFDRRGIGAALRRGDIRPLTSLVGKLRGAKYDLVVDAQGLARSAFFTFAAGARARVGYARPEARELAWLAYTHRVAAGPGEHAVDKMMALAERAGGTAATEMRLFTGPKERDAARALLAERGLTGQNARCVLLAPTSRWPGKRWPADRFALAAKLLLDSGEADAVVFTGGNAEREQCRPLLELAAENPRAIDLIGATSVGELMALVQGSALVIANDSAALHMAVGFQRPLVALYGPTRIDLVGPYRRESDVIQHLRTGDTLDHKNEAAGRALMERISVDEVVAGALERLRSQHPA
jgi:heptosyltransferase I